MLKVNHWLFYFKNARTRQSSVHVDVARVLIWLHPVSSAPDLRVVVAARAQAEGYEVTWHSLNVAKMHLCTQVL